jgi:spheroidene monooxygenase
MSSQVAVMTLVNIKPQAKFSGIARLMFNRFSTYRPDGLLLQKHMGSGKNAGFSVSPSSTHQSLFCLFNTLENANGFIHTSPLLKWYQDHANELFIVKLKAYSVKGKWSGQQLTEAIAPPASGPIASLTRASIKPLKAVSFWTKAPPAEIDLLATEGCIISAGVGEAPILRQATFTIWESQAAMDAYARSGAHAAAIKAAMHGQYFSESMFVRFQPFDASGSWKGRRFA